jgi:hypothetical protein
MKVGLVLGCERKPARPQHCEDNDVAMGYGNDVFTGVPITRKPEKFQGSLEDVLGLLIRWADTGVNVSVPGVDLRARPALEGIEHLDQVTRLPKSELRMKSTNFLSGLPGPQQRAEI